MERSPTRTRCASACRACTATTQRSPRCRRCDLLISLGARFDDRVTGNLSTFAPEAKIIHADIDPAEIGKNRAADVPIVGDAKHVLAELGGLCCRASRSRRRRSTCRHGSRGDLAGASKHPLLYDQHDDGPIKPQFVVDRFAAATQGDAVVVTGVGQHQMWASQFMPCNKPNSFMTSGGLGTMGFGVPAAFGAKVGRPDEQVGRIDGDGCFQMTAQELATATIEKIPFIVAILNNESPRAWSGSGRSSSTKSATPRFTCRRVPDYVKLAEAYGGVGLRATDARRGRQRRSTRRSASTIVRASSTSGSILRTRCASRWCRRARRTTT